MMGVVDLERDVMAAPMSLSYVLGEVWELLTARSWAELQEEASDVAVCGQLWLSAATGRRWNWTVRLGWSSAEKFIARRKVWRELFRKEGLEFHNRYLAGGGNYAKPHKVAAAFALARREQF